MMRISNDKCLQHRDLDASMSAEKQARRESHATGQLHNDAVTSTIADEEANHSARLPTGVLVPPTQTSIGTDDHDLETQLTISQISRKARSWDHCVGLQNPEPSIHDARARVEQPTHDPPTSPKSFCLARVHVHVHVPLLPTPYAAVIRFPRSFGQPIRALTHNLLSNWRGARQL